MPKKITSVKWEASNIPPGLSFDTETGTFSGTPEETGEYIVPVTVTTNYGTDIKNIRIISSEWGRTKFYRDAKPFYNACRIFYGLDKYHEYKLLLTPCGDNEDTYSLAAYPYPVVWLGDAYGGYRGKVIELHARNATNLSKENYGLVCGYFYHPVTKNVYVFSQMDIFGCIQCLYPEEENNSNAWYRLWGVMIYDTTDNDTLLRKNWVAGCWAESIEDTLVVASDGTTVNAAKTTIMHSSLRGPAGNAGISVNPGCAAWTPLQEVFCVCGEDGTSTSTDGLTWNVHTDAPKNLIELTYREDLGKFFARSIEDKMFYTSEDGATWEQINNTPIPLEDITAVDYNSELGLYCAVGTASDTAYFSKDLDNWIAKKFSDTAVDAVDVKYISAVGVYLIMPTSGVYCYTFEPSSIAGI